LRAAVHIKEDVQEAVSRGIEEGVARVLRKNNFRKKIVAIDQHHRSSDGMLRIYPRGEDKTPPADGEISGECVFAFNLCLLFFCVYGFHNDTTNLL
jgi:hypothetical protein